MLKNIFINYHFFAYLRSILRVFKIPLKLNYRHFFERLRSASIIFIYCGKILKYERFRTTSLEKNVELNKNAINRDITTPSSILYQVISDENGVITHHLDQIKLCKNGIEYYFVEVTSNNGVQYGIYAFGAEAFELYKQSLFLITY